MSQIIPDSIDPVKGWRVWSLTVDPRPSFPESLRQSVRRTRTPRFLSARHLLSQDGASIEWKLYSPSIDPYRDSKRVGLWKAHEAKTALCLANKEKQCQKPLQWKCSCGVYAFRSPELITDQVWIHSMPTPPDPPSVVGQILGWGHVIEHEQGWRATFAYPTALALCCMYCLANHALVRAEVVRFPTYWDDPFSFVVGPVIVPLCRACARPSRWWSANVCLPAPAVEATLATHYGVAVLPALPRKREIYHVG